VVRTAGESRSLEAIPGRQVRTRGSCNLFPKPVSQKTYGNGYLRLLRVMGGAFVAEKRLRHPFLGAAEFYFWRKKE